MKIDTQCTECGKMFKVNLVNVQAQFVKYTCQSCGKENVLENPQYSEPAVAKSSPKPIAAAESDRSSILMGYSIRTKIITVFVLLVLLSLSVVGWVASAKSRNALADQAEQSLKLNAVQKAREYSLAFQRIQQEVEAAATFTQKLFERKTTSADLNMRQHILMPWTGEGYGNKQMEIALEDEILTSQHLVPFLVSLVNKNPYAQLGYMGFVSRMMVLDNPAAVRSIGQLKGYENTKRPWYIKATKAGKTIWTEPYVDADTKNLIVTCATPVILNNGRLIGVAAYDVLLSTIQKDILTLSIGYDSYAFLVDNKGSSLVRPGMDSGDTRWDKTYNTDDLLRTSNSGFNKIIEHMINGQSDVEIYETQEGEKYLAYAPLPAIGASMAIVVSKGKVVAPAVAIQNFILIVWAVVLVIAIAAGFYIGNGISKPINELTDAADRISQGEMDLEMLTEYRKDEIGRLTQAFNRLVTSLKIAMSEN